ncbi:hypothetical protein OKS01_04765 [Clostridioides difficile]|nr:hypothetical protein [Clostridioides difficile]
MFILAFIICTVVIFIVSTKINQKRYDELNLMLNQILEGKEVTYPDTKDTRASFLRLYNFLTILFKLFKYILSVNIK